MQQQLICDVFQSGLNGKNSTYISLAHLLTTSLLNPMDAVRDCRVCMPSSIRFRWSCTKCCRVSGVAGEDAAGEDVAGEDAAGGGAAGGNSGGGDIKMCYLLGLSTSQSP